MSAKHPGFKKEVAAMAKDQGIPRKRAAAELASSTRNASDSAKKANPRLNRVKGK